MADPFRLTPPVLRLQSLSRPRLLAELAQRWHHRLTVVIAGAGFGKSTLLTQAMAENELAGDGKDVWLGCTAGDRSASSLATGIAAGFGVDAVGADVAELAHSIGEAILQHAPEHVCLLLDDVHRIEPDSAGADLLDQLLAGLPANGHMVMTSRSDPPISFARHEALGEVSRVDEGQLAFTADEMADFARLRGIPWELLAGTGGWPALMDLGARATRERAHQFVFEEVLETISAKDRQVLADLSLVGPFDDEMVNRLGHTPEAVERILTGLPLVSSAQTAQMLHPIWRDVLAPEIDGEREGEVRRIAAQLNIERDLPQAAMEMLLEGEQWDDACDAVSLISGVGHPPVETDVLHSWLARLPDAMRDRPGARLLRAIADQASDPHGTIDDLLGIAEDFRAADDTDGELAALFQLGYLAFLTDSVKILARGLERVLQLEASGSERATAVASLGRAIIADSMQDHDQMLEELNRIPPSYLIGELQTAAGWLRGQALLSRGDLGEAAALLEDLPTIREVSPFWIQAQGALLQCRWLSGRIEESIADMEQTVELARTTISVHASSVAASQATCAHAIIGRTSEARTYLEAVRGSGDYPAALVTLHQTIAEVALLIAEGQEDEACHRLRQGLESVGGPEVLARTGVTHRMAALPYVLMPEAREILDAVTNPVAAAGVALARAVLAARRGEAPPQRLPEPGVVRSRLPVPWIIEVVLAGVHRDDQRAWELARSIWPDGQEAIRAVAASSDRSRAKTARRVLAQLPVPPRDAIELRVLGPTELELGGTPVDGADWRRERVRQLLLFLVAAAPTTRDEAAAAMWPDFDEAAASRNLRATLHYLLRVLEPDRAEGEATFVVQQSARALELAGEPWLSVDAWTFQRLLDEAAEHESRRAPSEALGCYEAALHLWRGDYLTEVAYEDWATAPRDELRARHDAASLRASELLIAGGHPERAIVHTHRVLEADEWSDRAHQLLVAAQVSYGDTLAARRAAERYRAVLRNADLPTAEADDLLKTVSAPR